MNVQESVPAPPFASAPAEVVLPPAGPLSPEHFRILGEARIRGKRIRRAASIAVTSGWTMLFFGMLTLLGGLLGDVASLAMGVALILLAINELIGASLVRGLEPRGSSRLGINQLVLACVILLYAAWSLKANLDAPALSEMNEQLAIDPQMQEAVGSISRLVVWGLYGTMAVVGTLVPALTAWYYFSRASIIRNFIAAHPPWVIELMRKLG